MWTFFCLVLVFFLSFLVLQSSSSGREGCFTLIVVLLPCSCLLLAVLWVGLKYVGMTFLCHTHLLVNAMEFGYLFQRQAAKAPTSPWKYTLHAQIQRGGGGCGSKTPFPGPWKITKLYGFLAILVRIPWKIITKLPSEHSMLGHHRPASETPIGVSLAGRWWPDFIGIWILSSLIN